MQKIEAQINTLKSLSIPSNLLESSGSWFLISSEPMKILSRWDHVLCTSIQIWITWSAVDSFFCQDDTSCKKWAMNFEDNMFCSCTCSKKKKISVKMKIPIYSILIFIPKMINLIVICWIIHYTTGLSSFQNTNAGDFENFWKIKEKQN